MAKNALKSARIQPNRIASKLNRRRHRSSDHCDGGRARARGLRRELQHCRGGQRGAKDRRVRGLPVGLGALEKARSSPRTWKWET